MDEVRERLLVSDDDDRDPLPVTSLELGLAGDVNLLELEGDVYPHPFDDPARALAKMAPVGAIQLDGRRAYG
jgi:hypothetical protein